jgi:hypothetical protein
MIRIKYNKGEYAMCDGDYGIYGKGFEGYSHYMQAFEESQKGSSGGGPRKSNNGNSDNSGCIVAAVLMVLIYIIIKTIIENS